MESENEAVQDKWFAVYLFYPGALDLVLRELVAPFIREFFPDEQTDAQYFFIRYWENGNHIRLRINVEHSLHKVLAKVLEQRAKVFFSQYPAVRKLKDSVNKDINQSVGQNLIADHVIQFSIYEPEIIRYGNQQSLAWAEQHFFKSSTFILDWICTKKPGTSALIQALRLHLILLLATGWEISRLITVCDFFIDGWLPRLYISGADMAAQKIFWLKEFETSFNRTKAVILPASKVFWEELTAGTANQKVQDLLKTNILILRNYQQADFKETKFTEIMTSLMHMNNNRLGISNHEEAYGMYCTLQCLDFIANS
ncbi:thiopeptide-type bacteriocin biosynthesis protein [Pedobacter sp. UYP1]|uniref:thiopeptide-type bacteriocin biosynthesis protein n=1 Tax=Pedobacter sp. UYP1 TaxID=1756396 RepID=UPI0033941D2F